MKTLLKVTLLSLNTAFLIIGPRPCYADPAPDPVPGTITVTAPPTAQSALDSFKAEAMSGGNATILNNAFAAYVHDVNNGTDGVMVGQTFYQWTFLTADYGFIPPTQYKNIGTPLVGVSIHFDRLINTIAPDLIKAIQARFPLSSKKFLPLMYAGAAPVYNWNAPENQSNLDLDVWTGLEFNW